MTSAETAAPAAGQQRLRHSRWLAVESLGEDAAVVFHTATGHRLRLSRPLYNVLIRFRNGASVREIAGTPPNDGLIAMLGRLVDAGLLVDIEAGEPTPPIKPLKPVERTLFRCPRRSAGEVSADVFVVGVPTDGPGPGLPGCRDAPAALRRRSTDFEYRFDPESGRPMGWFDVEGESRVLEGVTIEDWGDLAVRPGESQGETFARLDEVIADGRRWGAFPVVLGGDHSVTFPVVRRLQQEDELVVVQLDAHCDFDPRIPEPLVDHRSVARRLWALPQVRRVVQVGHRGFTLRDKVVGAPDGVEIVSLPRLRLEGEGCVLDAVPSGLAVYLTIDLCCLDPAVAPGTSRPSPGGMRLEEAKRLLRALVAARRVVGLDLVELNPSRDVGDLSSIAACHLLLTAMHAATAADR